MFYAPLLLVLAALGPFQPLPALLLVMAATGAFFGQSALMQVIRGRASRGVRLWTAIYMALCLGGGLPLLFVYHRWQLLAIGAAGLALFAYYTRLMTRPELRKQIRSETSEVLTVAILAMTAPAAYIVARGALDGWAFLIWAACLFYFCSSIFYLKMWFAAAKLRGRFTAEAKREAGRTSMRYHGTLAALVVAGSLALAGLGTSSGSIARPDAAPGLLPSLLLVAAYAPILARAFWGWMRLSTRLPSLRRVGMIEAALALWFTGCWIAMLRGVGV